MTCLQISCYNNIKTFYSKIFYYSVASTDESAFLLGGSPSSENIIAQFKDNQWSLYGNLQKQRFAHGTIMQEDQMMVIGGKATGKS